MKNQCQIVRVNDGLRTVLWAAADYITGPVNLIIKFYLLTLPVDFHLHARPHRV